jgi:oxygen-independent coproporphyrinogen-3 oxidase
LQPDRLAFYSYAHVPKGNGQRGFKDEDIPKDTEKRTLYQIGKELLQKRYHEIGMDHFALKRTACMKLTKTVNCTVISWGTVSKKHS